MGAADEVCVSDGLVGGLEVEYQRDGQSKST